jgi:hypothetical protein
MVFLTFSVVTFLAPITYAIKWSYIISGVLNCSLFPFLIHRYFYIDPLDQGIVVRDQAIILNGLFGDNFEGIKVKKDAPLILADCCKQNRSALVTH